MPPCPPDPGDDPIARAFDDFDAAGVDWSGGSVQGSARRIGPYELLRVLGEGGFGTVYLARQEVPLRRTVALKVLRASAASGSAVRRFEAERQALARLDHPSIASIHDAGVTDNDQPFFVMDYVEGAPITAYCDDHELDVTARVELVRDVCLAVQHAHQRGVIHRDLKPSNVMVAEVDGRPLPKVIDFGIAKFEVEDAGEAQSLLTLTGQVIGTPEYMSPEQAAGGARELDTRTDVYSLGVLLYELLTGTLPLETARTRGASLEEVLRVIREVDPPRPSQRLRTTIVDRGAGHLEARTRAVRGDLDWITLKALEKDPERRYASPLELARDLERFLDDRPVLATPPSARYRAAKLARRHRGALVAATLLLVSLVGGIIGTTTYLVRALASERRAIAERQFAEGQRIAAEARVVAESHPTRALLLALEAHELAPGRAANDALYAALAHLRERRVLYGHDSRLTVTQYDPERRWILTAAEADRFALLWDAESGALLHRLQAGDAAVPLATFARGGDWVVTASLDGAWTVWDAASGTVVSRVEGAVTPEGRAPVFELHHVDGGDGDHGLALDPSSRRMALACEDGVVRVVRPLTGELLVELGAPSAPSSRVSFDVTGELLAVAHRDFTYRAWRGADYESFLEEGKSVPGAAHIPTLLFAPDGRTLTCAPYVLNPDGPHVESTAVFERTGQLVARVLGSRPVGYAPDGETLHLLRLAGETWGWDRLDPSTGAVEPLLSFTRTYLHSPLARDQIVASRRDTKLLLDSDGVERDRFIGHVYGFQGLSIDAKRARIATGSHDRTARIWDLAPPTRPERVGGNAPSPYWPLVDTAAGPLLHQTIDEEGGRSHVVWDAERGRALVQTDVTQLAWWGRLTSSGSHFFVFHSRVREEEGDQPLREMHVGLERWDLATGERTERSIRPFDKFCLGPDGRRLLIGRPVGAEDLRMSLLDLDSGDEVPVEVSFKRIPSIFAWSKASDAVVLRTEGDRAVVLDLRTGRPRFTFAGHDADLTAFGFSEDGRLIMSASVDRTAIVRDAETGAPICRYRGLDGGPSSCGFSRDGRLGWVLCPTEVHFFDPRSAESIARFEPVSVHGPVGGFVGGATSRDGRYFLTVTEEGWFQRWPLDPVAYAREAVPRDFEPDELEQFRLGTPAERVARIGRIVRATPTAARLSRAASLLDDLGHPDEALTLHEEAVASDPLEAFPWFELGRHLAERSAATEDEDLRRALAARAIDALRRAGELGVALRGSTRVDAFDALRNEPAFNALLAAAD